MNLTTIFKETSDINTSCQSMSPEISISARERYNNLFPDEGTKSNIPSEVSNNEESDVCANEKYDALFNQDAENKPYYDDNGQLYRIGKDLMPNSKYEIHNYQYTTDNNGRINSASGTLHMKERDGRLPIKDSIEDIGKGDQLDGDDRGHLIGDQFDGSNGLENMIPQDSGVNRNDFKNFENELAKAVKDGHEVIINVEPIYDGDSRRPDVIIVSFSINGEENVRIFPNNQEVS